MVEHLERGSEHAVSRTREVASAEVKVWKNELEFSSSRETAWQSVTVVLERNFLKNDTQVALAKLSEMVSNAVGISEVVLRSISRPPFSESVSACNCVFSRNEDPSW